MLTDLVPASAADDEAEVDVSQLAPILSQMERHLDEREQHIVRERFGLGPSGMARTLRALAADLGISKERVRQLQIKAMAKLREIAAELQNQRGLVSRR